MAHDLIKSVGGFDKPIQTRRRARGSAIGKVQFVSTRKMSEHFFVYLLLALMANWEQKG